MVAVLDRVVQRRQQDEQDHRVDELQRHDTQGEENHMLGLMRGILQSAVVDMTDR